MTVKEYLKQDRQWPRNLRIAHAVYQHKNAVSEQDKNFWKEVIKSNQGEII